MRFILLFLIISPVYAISYVETNGFRQSNYSDFHYSNLRLHTKTYNYIKLNVNAIAPKNIEELVSEYTEKDLDVLKDTISKNLGDQYIIRANANIKLKYKLLEIEGGYSGFANIDLPNPVFPEVNMSVLLDKYVGVTVPIWTRGFTSKLKAIVGKRKTHSLNLKAVEFLERHHKVEIEETPFYTFSEVSLINSATFGKTSLFLDFNSIPMKTKQGYFETVIGFHHSFYTNSYFSNGVFANISPLYQGDYTLAQTLKFGFDFTFLSVLTITPFVHDLFLPGVMATLDLKVIDISAIIKEEYYEGVAGQKHTNIGINASIKY